MATWRPPQRIRTCPTPDAGRRAAEVERSRLFSGINVGALRLSARTWVPAMVPWRATEDGFVSDKVLAWYERFAQGRPAAMVVEATGIRDIPSGPLLRIGDDRFLPGCNVWSKPCACERRRNQASDPAHRLPRHSASP